MTPSEILKVAGCGDSALAEIEQTLATIDIKLNRDHQSPLKKPTPPLTYGCALLATPIRELFENETRICNAFLVGRINTLGELVRFKEQDLQRVKNLGKTSLALVKDTLKGLQLRLGMNEEELAAMALHRRAGENHTNLSTRSLPSSAASIPVEDISGLSTRTVNCLKEAGLNTIGAVMATPDHDLLMINGFGNRCLSEIKDGLALLKHDLETGKASGLLAPTIPPEDRPFVPLDSNVREILVVSSRLHKCLANAGVRTLEDLIRLPAHQILRLPGIDHMCLNSIREQLKNLKLGPGMSDEAIKEIRRYNSLLGQSHSGSPHSAAACGPFSDVLHLPIDQAFDDETRVQNSLAVAGVKTVGDLVHRRSQDLLALPHVGHRSLEAISKRLSTWHLRLGMTKRELDEARASSPPAREEDSERLIDVIVEFSKTLPQRDREILTYHYNPKNPSTLEKTGRRFKLTRERVRQLIRRSCRRMFVKLLRTGLPAVAAGIRNSGGYLELSAVKGSFLNASEIELRPLSSLINAIAASGKSADAVYFDSSFLVWHLGPEPIIERLKLRTDLVGLVTTSDVARAVSKALSLPESQAAAAHSIAVRYCTLELVQMPGHDFWWRRQANKRDVVEGLLLHLFPSGAHFSDIAAATKDLPGKWRLEARNVHVQLGWISNAVLWDRGSFRHKETIRLNEALLNQLLAKADELFADDVSTISVHAVFDKNKSLAVQAGLPNPYALYGCLEWLFPKKYLYRHFPDIESLSAKQNPRPRRVAELEAILADSDGPLTVDQIIQRMGGHRRMKEYQIAQRLPESGCVLLYDAGCFVHETVLGISTAQKLEIRKNAQNLLRQLPGYATTKTIRLALTLPTLQLPWTLRLLGSVLEQDPALTRIYNVVALGQFGSWDDLLEKIILDVIGTRPGIRIDELNDHLIANGLLTAPLPAGTFKRLSKIKNDDGYVRSLA